VIDGVVKDDTPWTNLTMRNTQAEECKENQQPQDGRVVVAGHLSHEAGSRLASITIISAVPLPGWALRLTIAPTY
jgi:hypothetical protein